MDNLRFYQNLENSVYKRNYSDQMINILSNIEKNINPHVAFLNLNLENEYYTNVTLDNIDPYVDSYYTYLSSSFFGNKKIGIKSEWIYFEMLRRITSIIDENKEKFSNLYNGRNDKINLIHKFDLNTGFKMDKFTSYLLEQIIRTSNFDISVFSNISKSIDSKIAFNLISLFSGKNYYEYFLEGAQGCQGPPQSKAPDYKGFEGIYILDTIDDYEKMHSNILYLIDVLGKIDKSILKYLEECRSFTENLIDNIKLGNFSQSEFLNNLLFESRDILNHGNNLLITINYGKNINNIPSEEVEFIPYDITFGLSLVKDHNYIEDLKVPHYGYVMYQRYLNKKQKFYKNNLLLND